METAHDKHRILSLLRYNENKIQFNRNKNYKKKLENEKSLRRKLKKKSNKSQNDSKKNKFKVHREGLPEVEDGKSFDNAVRVLKNPPQEMREAKTDLSRKIPPTPKVWGLNKQEKKELKNFDQKSQKVAPILNPKMKAKYSETEFRA